MANAPSPVRVLVVDDEQPIRDIVRGFLEREGMVVFEASDGPSAVEAVRVAAPDVVILDIMLPGFDGLEVLRRIRAFADPFVLMLTARNEELDRVVGLTVGADDYVTKPFSAREVVARVQALLRRSRAVATGDERGVRQFGSIRIDVQRRSVAVGGTPVTLTALEFDLLATLARNPGIVLTRQQLLDSLWGEDFYGDDHVLDVHVAKLRRKLGQTTPEEGPIETVRGVGFRLAKEKG